jgi:membrane protein implicated in regulation of membrane protease activity
LKKKFGRAKKKQGTTVQRDFPRDWLAPPIALFACVVLEVLEVFFIFFFLFWFSFCKGKITSHLFIPWVFFFFENPLSFCCFYVEVVIVLVQEKKSDKRKKKKRDVPEKTPKQIFCMRSRN